MRCSSLRLAHRINHNIHSVVSLLPSAVRRARDGQLESQGNLMALMRRTDERSTMMLSVPIATRAEAIAACMPIVLNSEGLSSPRRTSRASLAKTGCFANRLGWWGAGGRVSQARHEDMYGELFTSLAVDAVEREERSSRSQSARRGLGQKQLIRTAKLQTAVELLSPLRSRRFLDAMLCGLSTLLTARFGFVVGLKVSSNDGYEPGWGVAVLSPTFRHPMQGRLEDSLEDDSYHQTLFILPVSEICRIDQTSLPAVVSRFRSSSHGVSSNKHPEQARACLRVDWNSIVLAPICHLCM